jgi:hypothetical protein
MYILGYLELDIGFRFRDRTVEKSEFENRSPSDGSGCMFDGVSGEFATLDQVLYCT